MNRREVCKGILASLATIRSFESRGVSSLPQKVDRLFPTDLPLQKPVEFPAEGFNQYACGVIYNQIRPPRQGMALGAIDTGYLSLEVDASVKQPSEGFFHKAQDARLFVSSSRNAAGPRK